MNSSVVNKLIRSEVWPRLRTLGFSKFEARTAFRFCNSLIHVVNLQSFSLYLAESIGCTTFSFGLNIGVYVVGSDREDLVKKDPKGFLLPREYECAFRTTLRKRTPVDGFARADIFYLDPDGHTAGPVFREVDHLLSEVAKPWFDVHSDINVLIARMEADSPNDISDGDHLGLLANRGSYAWWDVLATLKLLKHAESPSSQTAQPALQAIDHAIGELLDFTTTLETPVWRERQVLRIRELWKRLGPFAPVPSTCGVTRDLFTTLMGEAWATSTGDSERSLRCDGEFEAVSAREQIWPVLRNYGFTEFTRRLAHRLSKDFVEVVEIAPIESSERKAAEGRDLFRVGIGIFWPILGEEGLFRKDSARNPRPQVVECHLSNWLVPAERVCTAGRSIFKTPEQARRSLEANGIQWFTSFRNPESAFSILRESDWEIFWCAPMLRGGGAKQSTRRLIFLAYLAARLNRPEQEKEYIRQAERAIERYPEHLRERFGKWLHAVTARFAESALEKAD